MQERRPLQEEPVDPLTTFSVVRTETLCLLATAIVNATITAADHPIATASTIEQSLEEEEQEVITGDLSTLLGPVEEEQEVITGDLSTLLGPAEEEQEVITGDLSTLLGPAEEEQEVIIGDLSNLMGPAEEEEETTGDLSTLLGSAEEEEEETTGDLSRVEMVIIVAEAEFRIASDRRHRSRLYRQPAVLLL
jgi:hypothetical protein